jgi:serine/threonine protein kinase
MTQLGRYEVLKPLGRGSMAELLLARTSGMQAFERHVVIKKIRPDLAANEQFVRRFLNEARLAASLHHQHIVQVHDVGEQDGAYFFAMEYVHGEDLRTLIQKAHDRNETIPLEIVGVIVIAAASGLHHAHEKRGPDLKPLGLVHRDVSPANVLVGYDGAIKLVDFGLAKAALNGVQTSAGALKGNVGYMSPEQCRGEQIDRRSDVFGLGIVLYELLTARRLYKEPNEFLTMAAIVNKDVAPPSTHRAGLPTELDQITLRALAKDVRQRYQTADELRAALEQFMVSAELRTSVKQLADYMKHVFGERPEPWLVPAPPSLPTGAGDTTQTKTAPRTEFVHEEATIAEPPRDFSRLDQATDATAVLRPSTRPPVQHVPGDDTTTRARTGDLAPRPPSVPPSLPLAAPPAAEDAATTIAPPRIPPSEVMTMEPAWQALLRRIKRHARELARQAPELIRQPAGMAIVAAIVILLVVILVATCAHR